MTTYRLTMSYDGASFSGFQRQSAEDLVTVQGLLEATYAELFGERIKLHGAGRTDAGVHARAQVAHLASTRRIPPERLQYALNRALPPTLVITDVRLAADGFHARKSAIGKWYSYRIYNAQTPPALGHGYFTHIPQPLDRDLFEAALAKFVGHYDFEGFCGRGATVQTFDRTLYLAKCCVDAREPAWWQVHFVGDGFLRKMVRNLIGTAADIALGRRPLSAIDMALASGDRSQAGPTAPAEGLTMEEVFYEAAELETRLAQLAALPQDRVGPLLADPLEN